MTEQKPFTDRRILVVDDETFSQDIVRRMLAGLGASVVAAADGEAGIEMLKSPDPIDCVITDFNMPKMNGLEFLKAVRTGASGVRREMPMIMLTGHSDADLVGTALALDANGFIVKPVSQKVLADRLGRVLDEPPQIRPMLAYKVVQALTLADILKEARPEEPPKAEAPAKREPAPRPKATAASMPAGSGEEGPYRGAEVMRTLDTVLQNAVLTRDVRTKSGVQLLGAGQVLTPRLIQRLRDLGKMGEQQVEIWVRSSR